MLKTVILIIVGLLVLFGILPCLVLSDILYQTLLVRRSPEKWGRECSSSEDPECVSMFGQGMEWFDENSSAMTDESIENDGFKLCGQYFDFGSDKAVIIIPGRTESCLYSYYFAKPFKDAGYNVLVIDNRSHGLSEGRRNSLGYKEYRDVLAWGKFLHDKKSVKSIVLHGICIGASCGLFALTSPDCPDYMQAMISEGMYVNFFESFKNHMIEDEHPLFPILYLTMLYIRIFSGANVVSDGPIYRIGKMTKPILMLQSREDKYSVPELAKDLYEKCASEKKSLVYFDKGAHSRIRINNTDEYDSSIIDFLKEV